MPDTEGAVKNNKTSLLHLTRAVKNNKIALRHLTWGVQPNRRAERLCMYAQQIFHGNTCPVPQSGASRPAPPWPACSRTLCRQRRGGAQLLPAATYNYFSIEFNLAMLEAGQPVRSSYSAIWFSLSGSSSTIVVCPTFCTGVNCCLTADPRRPDEAGISFVLYRWACSSVVKRWELSCKQIINVSRSCVWIATNSLSQLKKN